MKYEELMKLKEEFNKNKKEVENMRIILEGFKELIKAEEKTLEFIKDETERKLIEEDIRNRKEEAKDMERKYELVKDIFTINEAMMKNVLETINEEELKEEWLNEAVQELLDRDKKVC